MLDEYEKHLADRALIGLPPLPLSSEQVAGIIGLLEERRPVNAKYLLKLLAHRVPPGVDDAAQVKASFLASVARGERNPEGLDRYEAVRLLGTMVGGYNVEALVGLLEDAAVAADAADALSKIILIYDKFEDVAALARSGNPFALDVVNRWAAAEWLHCAPETPSTLPVVIFKVPGETNTDDLSPATDVSTRQDIPLHALAMLKFPRDGVVPDEPGVRGPMRQLAGLRETGRQIAYCGDLVGTGSSRMSATNNIMWHSGYDLPYVPDKRTRGISFAGKFAPIFLNTLQDSGALPIETRVDDLETGDLVTIHFDGLVLSVEGKEDRPFSLPSDTTLEEFRVGGRINYLLGRRLTERACDFQNPNGSRATGTRRKDVTKGYTLAQKIVGRACGLPDGIGVLPGEYCEPAISSVASPDDAGPLTALELKNLGCLKFAAELVLQSFCHTVAYPNERDLKVQRELPVFMRDRGAVVLRPGDGIIHSWLNRLLLPDTVGTGADSHTRFPLGLSFPAGSGMVAFAAATGFMPLEMPESVLVRFKGRRHSHITIRDVVHSIPLFARRQGLLTLDKANKRNVFSGRIIEIEGLSELTVDQAFELADATAERSAIACTIRLELDEVVKQLRSNLTLIERLIAEDYGHKGTLERRRDALRAWLENPRLLQADPDAEYSAVVEIDLDELVEPVMCCPNDPDDARVLSEVSGQTIDEVFLGSCMTTASHLQAASRLLKSSTQAPVKLWVAPPTVYDEAALKQDGSYEIFQKAGARLEIPGCSLCMGNQARVKDGATVVSTSTRNFPNRMGKDAQVYLASAQLASICGRLGRIPTLAEYMDAIVQGTSMER